MIYTKYVVYQIKYYFSLSISTPPVLDLKLSSCVTYRTIMFYIFNLFTFTLHALPLLYSTTPTSTLDTHKKVCLLAK